MPSSFITSTSFCTKADNSGITILHYNIVGTTFTTLEDIAISQKINTTNFILYYIDMLIVQVCEQD